MIICTISIHVFTNKCLRKILRIFWPDQITNMALWKRTNQPWIDLQIRKRKWGWLGHTLQKSSDDIARQAPEWNSQGKRGRGRPKNTWRRTVLEEAKEVNKTWAEIKTDAKNRVRLKILVEALCSAAEWRDAIYIYLHTSANERERQLILMEIFDTVPLERFKDQTLECLYKRYWRYISWFAKMKENFIIKWFHKINFILLKQNVYGRRYKNYVSIPRPFSRRFHKLFPGFKDYRPCHWCWADTQWFQDIDVRRPINMHIQGVTGGTDQTSGECSLC